jgi:uncharacterized C2H2 Zn-finger protein
MLYIFKLRDVPYIKFGYTSDSPWARVSNGFWSNLHPLQCCNRLSFSHLDLVALYTGSKAIESSIKETFPPVAGEFWGEDMLAPMMTLLDFLEHLLPLPPREWIEPARPEERLACCVGGTSYQCWRCEQVFKRSHHLWQHIKVKHTAGRDMVKCSKCSMELIKRNLKRHEENSCRGRSSLA